MHIYVGVRRQICNTEDQNQGALSLVPMPVVRNVFAKPKETIHKGGRAVKREKRQRETEVALRPESRKRKSASEKPKLLFS